MSNKNKTYNNSSITLDIKHKEYIDSFLINETVTIPKLKEDIVKLKNKLKITKTIDIALEIKDKIKDFENEIKSLKKMKKKYLLDNSELLFDYFDDKKRISENTNINNTNSKNLMINNFFKLNNTNNGSTNDNITIFNDSSNILEKYLKNVDEDCVEYNNCVKDVNVCEYCNKGEYILSEEEGRLVCNNCFRSTQYLIENDKPSYKEPPKEVCFYAYKRINHFKEIISQFQGKETTQIPQEVIEKINAQIKKERITLKQITNVKTKEILKKLGFNKYYEHIPFIKEKLGIKPPVMSPELEETLCNLFTELQSPYAKYCPDDRVNFLNYYYTAYKLCELLGEIQYIEHFPMLKDREKRLEQDTIWKKICKDLNWEFIPTIV
jgi:hypothetical protein